MEKMGLTTVVRLIRRQKLLTSGDHRAHCIWTQAFMIAEALTSKKGPSPSSERSKTLKSTLPDASSVLKAPSASRSSGA